MKKINTGFLVVRRLILIFAFLFLCSCTVNEVVGPTNVSEISSDYDPKMKYQYVEVSRREGVKQKFLLIKPPKPWASVILFKGGNGHVGVTPHGYIQSGNFLVRNRNLFALQGLLVVVVDVPSDRNSLADFRHSQAHALDIKGVIAYLRELVDIPVWLIGTSNGCASAANVAARLEDGGADGLVLTSCVSRSRKGNSVFDASLFSIKVPTLVVHHKKDKCPASPYSGAGGIVRSLWKAPRKDLIAYEQKAPRASDPCGPWGNHGYMGIDKQVVKDIGEWIRSNLPDR
jgi:predicted alpha/beta-hydrolase family hydrolase